jgi:hypothetical protein
MLFGLREAYIPTGFLKTVRIFTLPSLISFLKSNPPSLKKGKKLFTVLI